MLGTSVDFEPGTVLEAPGSIASTVIPFDETTWDTFRWGGSPTISRSWRGVTATGTALSVRLRTSTRGVRVSLFSTDVSFQKLAGNHG